MSTIKHGGLLTLLCSIFLLLIVLAPISSQAFTAGKTYDKSNLQEIKDLLIPQVVKWVEKDGWVLPTEEFKFEVKFDDAFSAACKKNAGKYKWDPNLCTVEKATGEPGHIYGIPFPDFDPKDPEAGYKAMENFRYAMYRTETLNRYVWVHWMNYKTGIEREVVCGADYLPFQGRKTPIANPKKLLHTQMLYVIKPFDLKGTISMDYVFQAAEADIRYGYIPMLRRIRRMSAACRSDPFLGSDFCDDDAEVWFGKNNSMVWKFIQEKNILVAWTSTEKVSVPVLPDGSVNIYYGQVTYGINTPGFQGCAYFNKNRVWVPRKVWVVEGMPVDPYYNFGKHIMYVDQDIWLGYMKVVYDKAGEYWRTDLQTPNYLVDTNGRVWTGLISLTQIIDDRANHSSTTSGFGLQDVPKSRFLVPENQVNINYFSESNMRQMSK